MYYSVKEVSAMFKCGTDTIRRWIYEGNLKAVKVRNHYKIKKESIEEMLQAQNGSESKNEMIDFTATIIGNKEEV